METKKVSISDIVRDQQIMPRVEVDQNHVNKLFEAIKEGAELPPVDLFFNGKEYVLADGHHRHEAFLQAGHKMILAFIRKGDAREAFFFSCGVDAKHGRPLTNKDKRKVVDRLLACVTRMQSTP